MMPTLTANDREALEEIQRLMNGQVPPARLPAPFYIHDGSPIHLTDLYRGGSAFLICGGPSFGGLDHSLLKHPAILTMGVNNSVKTFRPDLWTHVDQPDHFIRSIFKYGKPIKFSPMSFHRGRIFDSDAWAWTDLELRQCPGVMFYKRDSQFDARRFLSTATINWGTKGVLSCMFPAIRILFELGIRRIYLLGADFHMQPEKQGFAYHFQETKDERAANRNNDKFPKIAAMLQQLRPVLEDAGMRIFNCNSTSRLTVFEHVSYEAAIRQAIAEAGDIDLANERTEGLYHNGNKPPLDVALRAAPRPAVPNPENHHMHIQARAFVEPIARSLGQSAHAMRVLEIGSYNVNGSIRDAFRANGTCEEFIGIDRLAGPGVDVVSEARDFDGKGGFDVVVSMEAMEHAAHPLDIIRCAVKSLKPGGTFIVTAAAEPRKPHGADGRAVKPGEHYANINPGWLRERLQLAGFEVQQVEWDDQHGDVYAVARKAPDRVTRLALAQSAITALRSKRELHALTIVTLTGDRHTAFTFCERWMKAQTRQPDRWIVVDDGHVPTQCTMGQTVIRLQPMPGHSLARNLIDAIDWLEANHILTGAVAFIEDDDYYAPHYLEKMQEIIDGPELVGECHAVYYHVGARAWWQHKNGDRASLCQTVVRGHLLPAIRDLARSGNPFIDREIWKLPVTKRLVSSGTVGMGAKPMVVGIKGMPGRKGIGIGHDASRPKYVPDPELKQLAAMIGDDAQAYAPFAAASPQAVEA